MLILPAWLEVPEEHAAANGIRLPVLLPAPAPILISQLIPSRRRESQSKGVREGLKAAKQLMALVHRPLVGRQPCQQGALIRCFRCVLHSNPMQAELIQLPEKRFFKLGLNRKRQPPPHHSVTG